MKYNVDNEGAKMKDAIQRKLQEEYESRQNEFASYSEFIRAKANESEFVRQIKAKISKIRRAA